MKNFIFKWFKNEKFGNVIERHTRIESVDAKAATDVFMKTFGNLKKNTIISIQEIDKDGRPVGEKIVPEDSTLEMKK